MLQALVDAAAFSFFAVAVCFIGVIGHLIVIDFVRMRQHPNYMSFAFGERKTHMRLVIALGMASWLLLGAIFVLLSMKGAT